MNKDEKEARKEAAASLRAMIRIIQDESVPPNDIEQRMEDHIREFSAWLSWLTWVKIK